MTTPSPEQPQPTTPPQQYAVPPQGYAAPPAGYTAPPPHYAPAAPTNLLAILSLVFSILGVSMLPLMGSVAGVIMGHIASKQIVETGEQGAGLAKAGTIIGYVGGGLFLLIIIGYFAFFALFFGIAATGAGMSLWF